jgi:hypothetical protein
LSYSVATDVKEDVLTVFNEEQTMVLKTLGAGWQYRWEDELAILRCRSSLMTDALDLVT